ncbi:MAG: phage tail protein [Kofleriaceae bacterium]
MALVYREDPYPVYNFEVVINGVSDDGRAVRGSFSEASGLECDMPPIEYRTGTEDITLRKFPGLKKYNPIVLKRGVIGDLALWNWMLEAQRGKVRRVEGSVVMLDENRQEVMRWNFKRAWPSKWVGPGFNAKNNEVAMETLEISHEGLEIDGQR